MSVLVATRLEACLCWDWRLRCEVRTRLKALNHLLSLILLLHSDLLADVLTLGSIGDCKGCSGPLDHFFPTFDCIHQLNSEQAQLYNQGYTFRLEHFLVKLIGDQDKIFDSCLSLLVDVSDFDFSLVILFHQLVVLDHSWESVAPYSLQTLFVLAFLLHLIQYISNFLTLSFRCSFQFPKLLYLVLKAFEFGAELDRINLPLSIVLCIVFIETLEVGFWWDLAEGGRRNQTHLSTIITLTSGHYRVVPCTQSTVLVRALSSCIR